MARVLVVDDDPSIRKLLTAMLEQFSFSCTIAVGGAEGLASLKHQSVDAVISDLQMPGITGLEFLVEVRRRYPDVAFLVATGVDDSSRRPSHALGSGRLPGKALRH